MVDETYLRMNDNLKGPEKINLLQNWIEIVGKCTYYLVSDKLIRKDYKISYNECLLIINLMEHYFSFVL